MRRPYWVLMILLAFGVLFAANACNRTGNEQTTGIRSESRNNMSDSDLKDRVQAKLNSDPQLKAADLSISADADKKEIKLSGTVNSEEQRMRAVELARRAEPGLIVTDKIDVKPTELSRSEYGDDNAAQERTKAKERGDTLGSASNDAWIHMKILSKLMTNPDTPMRKINVDVDNDVVTLRGTVDTAEQKAEAERVAKETDGVKRVINNLKTGKTTTSTSGSR